MGRVLALQVNQMKIAVLDRAKNNWHEDGDPSGPAVVFAGSLGRHDAIHAAETSARPI
jgi:hypothetical protein